MKALWMAWGLTAATAALGAIDSAVPGDGPDLTGWIVDARTGKPPLVPAVVHVTWALRAEADSGKVRGGRAKQVVKEVNSIVGGRFYIIDWMRHVDMKGWKLVPGKDPVVRIYAPGYQRVVIENVIVGKGGKRVPVNVTDAKEWKWVGEGAVQALQPLRDDRAALAAELTLWRRDLDRDMAVIPEGDRQAAIRDREKLLVLFDQLCGFPSAAPAKLCYAPDSQIGRFVAEKKAERAKYLVIEEQGGQARKYPIEAEPASSNRARSSSPQEGSPAAGFSGIPPPTPSEK